MSELGFSQSRSVRFDKQRLREEGLAGLFDHPIPGRPAVTTRTAVEKAVIQAILEAVIARHTLPDDVTSAERVNRILSAAQVVEAGQVTASEVRDIFSRPIGKHDLDLDIVPPGYVERLPMAQNLDRSASRPQTARPGHCPESIYTRRAK